MNKLRIRLAKRLRNLSIKVEPKMSEEKIQPILRSDAKTFLLGEDPYRRSATAEAVAELICSEIEPPFTTAVQGEWGSGKSIFVDLVLQALKKSKKKNIDYIKIDAYEFEVLGNLVYPLIREILKIAPWWYKGWRWLVGVLKLFWGIFLWLVMKCYDVDAKYIGVSSKEKYNTSAYKRLEKEYRSIFYIRKQFGKIVNRISKTKKLDALLIVIDELDRCSGQTILTLIDSIRNYLQSNKCIFLLAVDSKAIQAALIAKYGKDSLMSGEEYLRKIVGYSIDLRMHPDDFCELTSQKYKTAFPSLVDQDAIRQLKEYYSLEGSSNLRSLNRILDRYVLAKKLIETKKLQGYDDKVILFLAFMYEMHKGFYEDIKALDKYRIVDMLTELQPYQTGFEMSRQSHPRAMLIREYCYNSPVQNQCVSLRRIVLGDKSRDQIHPEVVKCRRLLEHLT